MCIGSLPTGSLPFNLILVVKDGKIIERGSHMELLDKKGYYHELYSRQFEEEAAMKIYAGNL